MKKSLNTGDLLWPVLLVGALLAFWQGVALWSNIPRWILPGPYDIVTSLKDSAGLLLKHARYTIFEAGLGFGIGSLLGVMLALLMDRIYWLYRAFYPLVIVSQTIPIIFLAPLLIIWFGFGILPKILVSILVCFFPVTISFFDGLANVDEELVNLLKSMGASPRQIMTMVKLPAALPSLFSGLRISATYSVMAAVIGEWLGASYGLGVFMTRASQSFSTAKVFAAILVVSLLSLAVLGLVNLARKILVPWASWKNGNGAGRI
ncbi:MAG TPA: ABC transporter permease [Clostridia bacterium]|nr:ABC transporter permease [Clostridia bacterium]